MTVQKRTNPSGAIRWRSVVRVETGKYDRFGNPERKQKVVGTFSTKKEAEKAEREFLNNFEANKIELNNEATVYDVVKLFLDFAKNEGEYSLGTVSNYEGVLRNHLSFFKDIKVTKITPALIQAWERSMYRKKASPHAYNTCVKVLKASFNYALKLRQVRTNPFVEMSNKSIPQKLRKRFSTDELTELIEVCRESFPEYYCLFVLATLTGARVGEYSALKVSDIDMQNRRIFINKQFTRGQLKNRTKKEASTRIVDISEQVLNIIQWHIKEFAISNDDFLFKTSKGNIVGAKWIERKFKALLIECGYDEDYCRVHDLRGQYVDIMHLCGVPLEYISRQVGHSNTIVTSKIYTQILHELPVQANALLDDKIFGSKKLN